MPAKPSVVAGVPMGMPPPLGHSSPVRGDEYAAMESTLTEATARIEMLKRQLNERGITPNC